MGRLITNALPNKEHGCAVITYMFKHGGESSHIIAFDSDEGCERVSIDTIARIRCETFDKEEY